MEPWTEFQPAYVPQEVLRITGASGVFMNSRYTVFVRECRSDGDGLLRLVHLSIKRNDKDAIRDWRDIQRVKNELLGPEWEGAELYPAESRLVDSANQVHLFCFEPPFRFPFGFNERCVSETESGGARQRPFELKPPDLATGDALLEAQAREASGLGLNQLLAHLKQGD